MNAVLNREIDEVRKRMRDIEREGNDGELKLRPNLLKCMKHP